MASDASVVVLCNDAKLPRDSGETASKVLKLDYTERSNVPPTVRIGLPAFVRDIYYLPDRTLDLIEIAAYVYCADRWASRGPKDAVEYHAWARSFHFIIKVQDHKFWSRSAVSEALSRALTFMTGDAEYTFTFQPGHSTDPTSLFDSKKFILDQKQNVSVMLFSGGLDSLAGTLQRLEKTSDLIFLVSHRSQPGTKKTQDRLVEALTNHYANRIQHLRFQCNLRETRAVEETQQTRAFLYTSIASAIAQVGGQNRFFICENGVTSMNFPRREDLSNARASRTTHPKTIRYLQELFSLVVDQAMQIETPLMWKTKTDVMADIVKGPYPELLTSCVSCSKTFRNLAQSTHCGGCSQCIDRRFAAYGAKADAWDHSGLYAIDMVAQSISEGDMRTTAIDYVRQARNFYTWNIEHFYSEMISELSDLVDYVPDCASEEEAVENIWELCRRHGRQVAMGMKLMRDVHDDLYKELPKDSLLQLISDREYLKNPVDRMAASIQELLSIAIPKMFSSQPPAGEPDLNLKVSALLDSHRVDLVREHPVVRFARGHSIPDHGSDSFDLSGGE